MKKRKISNEAIFFIIFFSVIALMALTKLLFF
jgi:hypothetical protein